MEEFKESIYDYWGCNVVNGGLKISITKIFAQFQILGNIAAATSYKHNRKSHGWNLPPQAMLSKTLTWSINSEHRLCFCSSQEPLWSLKMMPSGQMLCNYMKTIILDLWQPGSKYGWIYRSYEKIFSTEVSGFSIPRIKPLVKPPEYWMRTVVSHSVQEKFYNG